MWGHMGDWSGWGWGGMGFGMIGMSLFWILLIVAIVALVKGVWGGRVERLALYSSDEQCQMTD